MKRYEIMYFFREGIRGVFLHGFMSFAAIGIIAACLLIMGSFSLISININRVIVELRDQNEILALINDSYTEAEAKSVGTRINQLDNIASTKFISKDDALVTFRDTLGDQGFIVEGYEDDLLRHRVSIRLMDLSLMKETTEELRKMAGIDDIRVDTEITDFILNLRKVVNAVSITLIIMLLFVSVFIISNTVKLATFDRREEISIMKVVGATNAFIRWPFVVEGFLLGVIGALAGFFAQWAVYNYMQSSIADVVPVFQMSPFGDMLIPALLAFIGFGFIVGILGSVLTIRRFLKV